MMSELIKVFLLSFECEFFTGGSKNRYLIVLITLSKWDPTLPKPMINTFVNQYSFLLFNNIVTGPSLISLIFIIAPNLPSETR